MSNKKDRAFTIIELILVIAIVWILMMATTVYFWTDDKRRSIQAQWCVTTIWWEIHNFLFYALTSKRLRLDENTTVSPEYYIIQLTWALNEADTGCNSTWSICDEILLSYATWDDTIETYSRPSLNSCHWWGVKIWYYRSGESNINLLKMNKWFSATSDSPFDRKVFALEDFTGDKILLCDIMVVLCINSGCQEPQEISRFAIDWRSQTITIKNCIYYEDDDLNKCKTREWDLVENE